MCHESQEQESQELPITSLVDLGFEDAEELSVKAILAMKLNALIDQRRLSQTEAADVIGMSQPKVSPGPAL